MNLKKLLILALAASLALSLASCKKDEEQKCQAHVDADDDYKCDNCGVDYEDGDEATVPEKTTVEVNVKVVLDSGESLSGIKITLENNRNTYQLTSGADGSVKSEVEPGNYAISYDYESLPQYCSPETFAAIIGENGADITLRIVNNTPDGSKEKPFFISDNETELTLAPGQELYFNYRGSSIKYATVENAGAVINYGGEVYEAVDGAVTVTLVPEIGTLTSFSVKNVSDAEFSATLTLVAPLGSSENPIEMIESSSSATVSEETIVYYSWTAARDGVLVLTSANARNNISMTKVLENDVLIISQTAGSKAAYLAVSAGEVVTIGVSALAPTEDDKAEEIIVDFALSVYAGTESDPVPVLVDSINISLDPDTDITFSCEIGKTLSIVDESLVAVWHNGVTRTNEEGNEITVVLENTLFVLENRSDHVNGVLIEFE